MRGWARRKRREGERALARESKLARGHVGKGQRPSSKGNRRPGCLLRALGRAWLSEPAVGAIVIRASVRERTARRAVPTTRQAQHEVRHVMRQDEVRPHAGGFPGLRGRGVRVIGGGWN